MDNLKKVDEVIENLNKAQSRLQESAQGRVYSVGTKITFEGKFGVVTNLNKGSQDPAGSTVDIRLEDGKVVQGVSVTSVALQLFRQ